MEALNKRERWSAYSLCCVSNVKVLFFSMFFVGCALLGHGQSDEWKLVKDDAGIQLYYKLGVCDDKKIILFRANNPTDSDICIEINAHVKEENGLLEEDASPSMICIGKQQVYEANCVNLSILKGYLDRAHYLNTYVSPVVTVETRMFK